jgi:hypothetical protein
VISESIGIPPHLSLSPFDAVLVYVTIDGRIAERTEQERLQFRLAPLITPEQIAEVKTYYNYEVRSITVVAAEDAEVSSQ